MHDPPRCQWFRLIFFFQTYDWDNKSVILSSFFWGYITLQIFAGQLGNTYGTKWIVFAAMFVNASGCMLTPLLANTVGSYGVMGCRIVQGMSQGFFFPSVHNVLGQWAPLKERSFLGTIAFAGPSFGTIVAMPLTGYIAASWSGWPVSFYLFGCLGYCWMLAWALAGANNPAVHPNITVREREYIQKSLSVTKDEKVLITPWKGIFTSIPMWAIVVAMFGQNWGYSTLLTEMPTYMSKVMKFDMHSNGALSAAPYLASFIASFVFGAISDFIINSKYVSLENSRKLFNTIGTVVPSMALVILGFLPEDWIALSVMMLVIAVGVNAAVFVGFQINPVDLSPKFSGIIMGIGNGSSNIFSIIAPLMVQFLVTDETSRSQWRIIFIIAACVYSASNVFYVIFASGDEQWWNKSAEGNVEEESNQMDERIIIRTRIAHDNYIKK
ncbi:unnamed protein product [Phaedon cochleariae]|uniref:Major facilitator superfamily (MFS) profile domain-containing protein n=1 Tax=Phaedon cochleariae TaxID=80249 RepID=A0A9N9SCK6_PHACE|nr:unnamed protein product [Phaedon cochleariae]